MKKSILVFRPLIAFVFSCSTLMAQSLSIAPASWSSLYSTVPLYRSSEGYLAFNFPTSIATSTGYLIQPQPNKTAISGTLTMTVQIIADATTVFRYDTEPQNTCIFPAHVRPMIWGKGGKWTDGNRWWANPIAVTLQAGTYTISVALTPDQWSGVNGEFASQDAATLANFQAALSNVDSIGMTFGGGCFFSHSVYVTGGNATFELIDYHIQ